MESIKTRGIITRCKDFGESNCMLTVLADGLGAISVSAYGVRSRKSKTRIRLFSCADFVLGKKSGDVYRMEQMDMVDGFYSICEDITKLSLANYLSDLAKDAFSSADSDVLSLLLNAMYVLSYKDIDPKLVKAAFEIKISQYMGYEPYIDSCVKCGKKDELSAFDIQGGVKCKGCKKDTDLPMSGGTYTALRFILLKEDTKVFAFEVTDNIKKELCRIGEEYITEKIEKNYKSLQYLKKIMNEENT